MNLYMAYYDYQDYDDYHYYIVGIYDSALKAVRAIKQDYQQKVKEILEYNKEMEEVHGKPRGRPRKIDYHTLNIEQPKKNKNINWEFLNPEQMDIFVLYGSAVPGDYGVKKMVLNEDRPKY